MRHVRRAAGGSAAAAVFNLPVGGASAGLRYVGRRYADAANRLAAAAVRKGRAAVAVVELSSGAVDSVACALEDLGATLAAFRPSEVLVTDRIYSDPTTRDALDGSGGVVQALASAIAEPQAARTRVERLYGVTALDGFGAFEEAEVSALGLIAAYLETTQAGKVPALAPPRRLGESGFLAIDPATRASLEIDRTQRGEREGSLLACIDRTVTSGGARALAERIARPLRDPLAINEQLDAVEWLLERRDLRRALRDGLKASADVARAVGRLALPRGGPRELAAGRVGLSVAEGIAGLFIGQVDPLTGRPRRIALALDRLNLSPEVSRLKADLIDGLVDEPSHLARDGGFVRPDYRPELDAARTLRDDSRRVVADLEARAVAESGVPFKVKHNAVLGYFLETSAKAAEGLLRAGPDSPFIHRQTLASQVRFTTVELSELDARISQAGHRALAIEAETFEGWRREVARLAQPLQAVAEALAELDAHAALAEWAQEAGATRPVVDDSLVFSVEAGRHPVVEAAVKAAGDPYTPNNARLDGSGSDCARLAIVTGPNMAGKSTFLRSLTPELRTRAALPFEDGARQDWHYVPRERLGVAFKAMDEAQRHAAQDLLRAALSSTGVNKVEEIMALETVLREIEKRPNSRRDPLAYSIVVFRLAKRIRDLD